MQQKVGKGNATGDGKWEYNRKGIKSISEEKEKGGRGN